MSVWTIYKKAGEWDDAIEGPDVDGLEVVALDGSFDGLLAIAGLILDRHYPVEFFNTGNPFVGRDLGTRFVATFREVVGARNDASIREEQQ